MYRNVFSYMLSLLCNFCFLLQLQVSRAHYMGTQLLTLSASRFLVPDFLFLVFEPFLSSAPLHGMSFPFLSKRNPLWTPSNPSKRNPLWAASNPSKRSPLWTPSNPTSKHSSSHQITVKSANGAVLDKGDLSTAVEILCLS